MYNFVDTTESPGAIPLPAEAMSYGGVYIENEIEGYRTLYVEGREKITAEIDATETQTRHGASFRNMRYEPKTLIIGFQLICKSAAEMMNAYNKLLLILSKKQAQIIFNDEQDKYYTGTKTKITNTPPGRLAVTGEIEIYCSDPFKYSIQEYEATAADGVITVDYGGTHPAHPILTAKSEDHDSGFFYFRDQEGHSVQAGDPMEQDQEEVPDTAEVIVNSIFGWRDAHDLVGWEQDKAKLLYGYYTGWTTTDAENYEYASFEAPPGVVKYYYGAALGRDFAETTPGFDLRVTHWFEPSGNQGGGFDFYVNNQGGGNICGFSVYRRRGGNVIVDLIVKGRVVKSYTYSLANNPFKGNWSNSLITKAQGNVTFNVGGAAYTASDPELENHAYDAFNVSYIFYRQLEADQIGANNALRYIYIRSVSSKWQEIENKIPQNGLVEINTGSGDILLNGVAQPWLGTADNDFEDFELEYGVNEISCGASDWVDDAVYTMRYREVFL